MTANPVGRLRAVADHRDHHGLPTETLLSVGVSTRDVSVWFATRPDTARTEWEAWARSIGATTAARSHGQLSAHGQLVDGTPVELVLPVVEPRTETTVSLVDPAGGYR